MISSYSARLIWLALGSFFLLHVLFASAAALAARPLVRFAARLEPRMGARLLLVLRLLPIALTLAMVAAVCIPSYFYFEPEATAERIGLLCIAAALLTLLLVLNSVLRAARAATQSFRHMQRWRREARPQLLSGSVALVIDSSAPFLALAGILRPTLIASRGLFETLASAELEAAVRHEQAHRASHDNLKRLVMHCAPGLFPFFAGFTALEQAWARLAERAADDRSIAAHRERALHLADALVRVARAGAPYQPCVLTTNLLPDATDLRQRIERLLDPKPAAACFASWPVSLAAACIAVAVLQPASLRLAHELLEGLVR